MISKKKLDQYIGKRTDALIQILQSKKKISGENTLHDLRLHVKKLKAITLLMQYDSKHAHDFSLKPLKPLYQITGSIRTAQLHLQLLNKYNIHQPQLLAEQQSNIAHATEALKQQLKDHKQLVKKLKHQLLHHSRSLTNERIEKYYKEKIKDLHFQLAFPFRDDLLHRGRQNIKNMLYPMAVMPVALQQTIKLNKDYLDEMQELIGQWHDVIVTQELLSKAHCNAETTKQLLQDRDDLLQQIKIKVGDINEQLVAEEAIKKKDNALPTLTPAIR